MLKQGDAVVYITKEDVERNTWPEPWKRGRLMKASNVLQDWTVTCEEASCSKDSKGII